MPTLTAASAIAHDLALDRDTNPDRDRTAFRVLLTLIREPWRSLPTAHRARLCRLTTGRYERLAADPIMQHLLSGHVRSTITQAVPAMVSDLILNAKLPGRDGANDRRMFFNMAGLLTQNSAQRSETKVTHEIGPGLAAALARDAAARAAIPRAIIEAQAVPTLAAPEPPAAVEPAGRSVLDDF